MKILRILIMAVMVFASGSLLAQSVKTEKISVSGNCGSCKKHIETASKVDGVTAAYWDKNSKVLTISYDPAKISSDVIQKNIAAVGYDTEKYRADDKAYKELDECCQYERKSKDDKKKN